MPADGFDAAAKKSGPRHVPLAAPKGSGWNIHQWQGCRKRRGGHRSARSVNHEADNCSRDEVLGPPLCRIFERSAIGPLPPNAPPPPSLGVFAHRISKLLSWWVRGLARPTPFFDDQTNAPRAVPRVLTQSERAAL